MNSKNDNLVRLFGRELLYLRNAAFLPEDLRRIVNTAAANGDSSIAMSLSRDMAERFREVFTERLAHVGFDAAYEPTNEGSLLEALIDRFYVNSPKFQEYAVVRLIAAIPTVPVPRGTRGAVLIAHSGSPAAYEVEFVDDIGQSLGTYTVEEAALEEVTGN